MCGTHREGVQPTGHRLLPSSKASPVQPLRNKGKTVQNERGMRRRCCTKASHICFTGEGAPFLLVQQADGKAALKTYGAECNRLAGKLGRGEGEKGNLAGACTAVVE